MVYGLWWIKGEESTEGGAVGKGEWAVGSSNAIVCVETLRVSRRARPTCLAVPLPTPHSPLPP
jgi:hypothetical protein